MPKLLPTGAQPREILHVASALAPRLPSQALKAGIWLYLDDLDRSHGISQGDESPLGSLWHAVMHRREGDFSNSKYWLQRAGPVPFQLEGYDAVRFVDEVAAATGDPADLIERQRQEWLALFTFSARQAGLGGN